MSSKNTKNKREKRDESSFENLALYVPSKRNRRNSIITEPKHDILGLLVQLMEPIEDIIFEGDHSNSFFCFMRNKVTKIFLS